MKITIKEIAQMAGVSRAAVDKVLHNRPGVSEGMRTKVMTIVNEYHYTPNQAARALKSVHKSINFAIIIPKLDHPMFKMIKTGMDAATKQYKGYSLEINYYYVEGNNADSIIPILKYLYETNIDGLALRGVDDEEIKEMINRFSQKGVTVVTYDSDVPDSNRLCFIGENQMESGRIAAVLLAKCVNESGQVAVISGSNRILTHRQRVIGFEAVIADQYPDMQIVETIETFEQDVIAYEKTRDLILRYPQIKGFFNVAGCISMVAKAIADFAPARKIRIIGYNFVPEIVPLVKSGQVDFSIGLMPYRQGQLVIKTLFENIVYHEMTDEASLKLPTYICINENIEYFSEANPYPEI